VEVARIIVQWTRERGWWARAYDADRRLLTDTMTDPEGFGVSLRGFGRDDLPRVCEALAVAFPDTPIEVH
jgi:hypothetical protein